MAENHPARLPRAEVDRACAAIAKGDHAEAIAAYLWRLLEAERAEVGQIPQWLLDARGLIEENADSAGGAFSEQPPDGPPDDDRFAAGWDRGYWGGYYDACRHALKALPPYVKYPDAEDWQEEGFVAP